MNTASGGDKVSADLLKNPKKLMVLKCCTRYFSKFGNLTSGHKTGKGQFSFQFKRRAMPENVQTAVQLHSFHMLSR